METERWFDVITSDGERHQVSFTTPQQMEEWMVSHGVSTTIVRALWEFPDLRQWLRSENSFVRNAEVK